MRDPMLQSRDVEIRAHFAAVRPRQAAEQLGFALGVGVQLLLWHLLFLAIFAAVVGGAHATEFRYVGF